MDPLFLAYSFYRRRKFEASVELCSQLLEKNPYDQVPLKREMKKIETWAINAEKPSASNRKN